MNSMTRRRPSRASRTAGARWPGKSLLLPLTLIFPSQGWFDVPHYLQQLDQADGSPSSWPTSLLRLHYCLLGWRRGLTPHPLLDAGHYRAACLAQGLPAPAEPLHHYLRCGAARGLTPSPLIDPGWCDRWPGSIGRRGPASLDRLHPLGRAALLVSDHDPAAARARLQRWLEQGIPIEDRQWLQTLAMGQPANASSAVGPCHLQILGASLQHWVSHVWLQRLPSSLSPSELQEAIRRPAQPGLPIHVLHLPLDQEWWAPEHLGHLRRVDGVWDPSPERVQVLNLFGVHACCLDPGQPVNGWLSACDLEEGTSELGLPELDLWPTCGPLVLGTLGHSWEASLPAELLALPAFDAMTETPARARALASWLQRCQHQGLQLIRLQPSALERNNNAFDALETPKLSNSQWLPCQFFREPLSVSALHDELQWRRQGCPWPKARIETPAPSYRVLLEHGGSGIPSAAVCISLHNYADQITAALDSVRLQDHADLELIVVDDASSDDGVARVQAWLTRHSQRFARALLLQHQRNGGLASARNTAFAAARADWCFVLDADNSLEPQAVSTCLAIGISAGPQVAVVHPLIRDYPSPEACIASGLVSALPWQREWLRTGNCVDAMALVRRSAWQAVDGYAHIPGGWEDYDFWCCLIDAGFSGILCPRVLARYNRHPDSMQTSSTHPQLRRISRLLQIRHPWLELPLAAPEV